MKQKILQLILFCIFLSNSVFGQNDQIQIINNASQPVLIQLTIIETPGSTNYVIYGGNGILIESDATHNGDPDNNQHIGWGFSTTNYIAGITTSFYPKTVPPASSINPFYPNNWYTGIYGYPVLYDNYVQGETPLVTWINNSTVVISD